MIVLESINAMVMLSAIFFKSVVCITVFISIVGVELNAVIYIC